MRGCQIIRNTFIYSMILPIMANATQDQEKNTPSSNSASEEISLSAEVQPQDVVEADGESIAVTESQIKAVAEADSEATAGAEVETEATVEADGGGVAVPEAEAEAEVAPKDEPVIVADAKEAETKPEVDANATTSANVNVNADTDASAKANADVNDEADEADLETEEDYEDADGDVDTQMESEVNGDVEGEEEEEEEEDIEDEEDDEEDGEEGEEKVPDGKTENLLDHDQDRRNPQYIPKGGAFYEHDNRTSLEDVENKDPQEVEKKKKVWKESKESERWLHDWYKESDQWPKTKAEIIQTYGYDIRKEEAPPRARRRRKYGRGPDKYERNWEDEQAYMVKPTPPGRRGKKKSFGKDEFPPLPNRKIEASVEKSSPRSPTWKKTEDDQTRRRSPEVRKRSPKINHSQEKPQGLGHTSRRDVFPNRYSVPGSYSNRRSPGQPTRKFNDDDIKPFRIEKTKLKNNFRRGKPEEVPKPNKTRITRPGELQTPRNVESNKNSSGDSDVTHLSEGFSQMTFHSKHSNMRDNRQDSNEIAEQELDSSANRLNPKRYSKNRKSFTGYFPPEDIVEIDPSEMKQLQQEQQQKNAHVNLPQQPLNIQSVIRRYPGTYNGNPGYMAPRPIITGIPQQGMSPQGLQQALSPQGIPQQALSPQVPGLQTIELQQGPLTPQPNFVTPMFIDMDPHYGPSDMMGPYTGYAAYSASQPGEMYQRAGGITYYNTECQNSNQIRAPPTRRQKAAIPIVPPPE